MLPVVGLKVKKFLLMNQKNSLRLMRSLMKWMLEEDQDPAEKSAVLLDVVDTGEDPAERDVSPEDG